MMPETKCALANLSQKGREVLDRAVEAYKNPGTKPTPSEIIEEYVGNQNTWLFDTIKGLRHRELRRSDTATGRRKKYMDEAKRAKGAPEERADRIAAWDHKVAMEVAEWAKQSFPSLAEAAAVEQRRWAKHIRLVHEIASSQPAKK